MYIFPLVKEVIGISSKVKIIYLLAKLKSAFPVPVPIISTVYFNSEGKT